EAIGKRRPMLPRRHRSRPPSKRARPALRRAGRGGALRGVGGNYLVQLVDQELLLQLERVGSIVPLEVLEQLQLQLDRLQLDRLHEDRLQEERLQLDRV